MIGLVSIVEIKTCGKSSLILGLFGLKYSTPLKVETNITNNIIQQSDCDKYTVQAWAELG